jgi:hypothetical protein
MPQTVPFPLPINKALHITVFDREIGWCFFDENSLIKPLLKPKFGKKIKFMTNM